MIPLPLGDSAGMRVLLANNSGREARRLAVRFPDRIGHLYGPTSKRGPFPEFEFWGGDNDAWPDFTNERTFVPERFRGFLRWAAAAKIPPQWMLVRDKVADREETLRLWKLWAPEMFNMGFRHLAFAVQNGMRKSDVPPSASVVFVGGSTEWKWETVQYWCEHFPRVHVGRVNMERLLWQAHRAGAESCDGSGWFRGDRSQLDGLWYYLADSSNMPHDAAHGPHQPRLFAAGTVA